MGSEALLAGIGAIGADEPWSGGVFGGGSTAGANAAPRGGRESDRIPGNGGTETAVAAVCWVIGNINAAFVQSGGNVRVKDLTEYFGVRGSVAQRGRTMMNAVGMSAAPGAMKNSTRIDLLVSGRRGEIAKRRDTYREILAERSDRGCR